MALRGERYTFWNHGVSVVPEFTKEYTGTDYGLYLRRAGWGTQVRQNAGTSNWFHITIPTPTFLDNDSVSREHAWLRASVKRGAAITGVNIHHAVSGSSSPALFSSGNINHTETSDQLSFDLHNQIIHGPIVMSVRVQFNTNQGEVIFRGAGVQFKERGSLSNL